MDKEPQEDSQGHRVAQPQGVQPFPVESMADARKVAIPERQF